MALWQLDLIPIPAESIPDSVTRLGHDEMDRADWWRGRASIDDLTQCFDKWLPHNPSDREAWGSVDGTCASVIINENGGRFVLIRLDMRSLTREDIKHLLDLTRECRLKLAFFETGDICAEVPDIMEKLKTSAAAKFVAEPRGFIVELDQRDQ